jgi:hypothetical protein
VAPLAASHTSEPALILTAGHLVAAVLVNPVILRAMPSLAPKSRRRGYDSGMSRV